MMDNLENLKAWLRDAYAMEMQSIEVLRRQSQRIENYPEFAERIKQHLAESERQAAQIKECLQKLGADVSAVKDAVAIFTGNMQALAAALSSDEVLKGLMIAYMHEHLEIAAYEILAAAAERCGKPDIAVTCRNILAQEEAMQKWLREHMAGITAVHMSRAAMGEHEQKR